MTFIYTGTLICSILESKSKGSESQVAQNQLLFPADRAQYRNAGFPVIIIKLMEHLYLALTERNKK